MSNRPDPRAYLLESRLQEMFPSGLVDQYAVNDFALGQSSRVLRPGQGMVLLRGYVVDSSAYAHVYKVSLEDHVGVLPATLVPQGNLASFGARSTTTLQPGNFVLCAWRPGSAEALILGTIPEGGFDPRKSLSDCVVAGGNTGWKVDAYARGPLLLPGDTSPGVSTAMTADYSSHRPFDSLTIGEHGATTETGVGLHVDPFLAYLRVSEETGVFAFYQDELLRLAGRNLQICSSGAEREDADDAGMVSSEEGWAFHARETSGVGDSTSGAFRELTPEEVQLLTPWYYHLEPLYDDQQPFYRWREFRGWLPGGMHAHLQAEDGLLDAPQRFGVDKVFPGLFEQRVLGSGRLLLRSAKGVIIAKSPYLPSPKRKRPAHCDQKRSASPAQVVAELALPLATPEPISLLRASAIMDQLAYAANYEGPKGLLELPEAWYLPEEGDLAYAPDSVPPDFGLLEMQQYLPPGEPEEVQLNERYGTAKVYPGNALIAITDDGSVVIRDAWGTELRLTGGNAFLTAAGDVWQQAGRNINNWAGFDFIAKAQNSADITASQGDVRVKAQRNAMILGGNDTCGGVLIESKAPAASYQFGGRQGEDAVVTGVVLKAANSQIIQTAKDIAFSADSYTFTNLVRHGTGSSAPSDFILDVQAGKIVTRGKSFERRLITSSGYALDAFADGSGWRTDEHTLEGNVFHGDLRTNGSVLSSECVIAAGWMISSSGHFASGLANDNGGLVNKIASGAATAVSTALTAVGTRVSTVETWADAVESDGWDDFKERSSGDVTTIAFSMRTPAQYRTEAFTLYEAPWQQMARENGQTLPFWSEPVVDQGSEPDTMPYPGLESWSVASSGRRLNHQLIDPDTGRAKDRDTDAYDDAVIGTPTAYVLEGGYTVVIDAGAL